MEKVAQGITPAEIVRFVDIATQALGDAREEIDALNVYPVPDGDTGTNMFLTMSAARDALATALEGGGDLATALASMSRGALLGARGNSGVILSQMLVAFTRRCAELGSGGVTPSVLAQGMHAATEASYAAVGTPVEGTILSVSRAASDAAVSRVNSGAERRRDVLVAAAQAARAALERTPDQLEVLAQAGVVDAGGRGLCVVLDAAETVATGRKVVPRVGRTIPVPVIPGDDLSEDGPSYEVMYLLDADDTAIADLRKSLSNLGDSLVVVGGEGIWNVHVHVDDVGAAIEAGIEVGRPHRIRVTHFAEQVRRAEAKRRVPAGRGVVAIAAGPGLTSIFEEAGAVVVPGGPGRRPSAQQVLDAITATGSTEVVVLPNDGDSVAVCEIAARTAEEEGALTVEVIATSAQVQGLAALAVHEPGRTFEADVREMTATARQVRHGAVTIAARDAITMAGECKVGDVLGVVAGDFAVIGDDLATVAREVTERLLAGGGELVTFVSGEVSGIDSEALASQVAAEIEAAHPSADVDVLAGGQERYPLLVSVE